MPPGYKSSVCVYYTSMKNSHGNPNDSIHSCESRLARWRLRDDQARAARVRVFPSDTAYWLRGGRKAKLSPSVRSLCACQSNAAERSAGAAAQWKRPARAQQPDLYLEPKWLRCWCGNSLPVLAHQQEHDGHAGTRLQGR